MLEMRETMVRGEPSSGARAASDRRPSVSDREADALVAEMGKRARGASAILSLAPTVQKAEALRAAARLTREAKSDILAANAEDVHEADQVGITPPMRDRLKLDAARVEQIAAALESVASLDDPVGKVIDSKVQPNGLLLKRIRVPLGVVGIIFESRPNVTMDAGGLALMSGNAALLRGGSDAERTNFALHAALTDGIVEAGLPRNAVQVAPTTDRAIVGALLRAQGLIDVIIPRGGKGLVERVLADARVPVLAHRDGINHSFVHAAADPDMAERIVVNAKMRRTIVCGSTETLLIDRRYPYARKLVAALADAGCALRADDLSIDLDPRMVPATSEDWDTEYLDAICSVAMVDGVEGAIAHIGRHSSQHTDAIITADEEAASRFLSGVDSAIVMWNASTQFADGGEFGLGAEIGISTGRLHARGPVALEGLTTYKWQVIGTGQSRP
ncbi:glutamate-5-semialdehyde dehydrogenase [Pararhizobium sp. DWP3-4]|uniref:glutamate-5-semialdehyde dehydrogenase n=1 Tax=unclassified Pararhizobium TaxID=2643050 RepID=UPI003CEF04D1